MASTDAMMSLMSLAFVITSANLVIKLAFGQTDLSDHNAGDGTLATDLDLHEVDPLLGLFHGDGV